MSIPLVFALNAGSSSLKASVLHGDERLVQCLAERLGTKESVLHFHFTMDSTEKAINDQEANMTHEQALCKIVAALEKEALLNSIVAVGHRVVHGGTKFVDSAIIDDSIVAEIESVSDLAPLHNPANVAGIRLMRKILPHIPSVAIFDTSFHSTMPERAYTYPIPLEYRRLNIRKFGFHGTSVKFVSQHAHSILQSIQPATTEFNMIVCHLGNGASVTAVVGDKSMDTSMGFTPLDGLMMGTRCGSIDPAVVGFACHKLYKTVDEVMSDLNQRSGLKAMVSDGDFDMRSLLKREDKDHEAALAVDMFIYHIAQHVAMAMVALSGPLDALIFTAGIGEHAAEIRERTLKQLRTILQFELDPDRNANDGEQSNCVLSVEGTWPLVLDVPTDEEAMIASECLRLTVT